VLGADDRDAMLALTAATRPGPFVARTHELGLYLGVRSEGRLIAMAGERLRVDGATEVSAVCTDPAHQRRGLAAALVAELVERIHARGALPFLHVAADKLGALRVYEALGFTQRARIAAIILRAPACGARGYFLRLLAAAEREPGKSRARQSLPQKQTFVVPAKPGTQRLSLLILGPSVTRRRADGQGPRVSAGAREGSRAFRCSPWMDCQRNPGRP
jgi:GNAT superfamily N-acetyltransferase